MLLTICILISALSIGVSGAGGADAICPSNSKAYAIYFYNTENDTALYDKNSDKKISPASTVKLMTALVAFDKIDDVNKSVTVTEKMLGDSQSNVMKLKEGEKIKIKDLFAGLVCAGYNDAACALAVIASGSIEAFIEEMNAKALSLGAINTFYADPTGIDDSAQTTARDVMLIAKEFMTCEFLFELSSLPSYEVPKTNWTEVRILHNRNAMISNYSGSKYLNSNALGMNAGMTSGGGYCVVTSMKRDGMTYIGVVMGGVYEDESDTVYSYAVANELLNYVARNLGYRVIVSAEDRIDSLPVIGANTNIKDIDVAAKEDVKVYVPSDYLESDRLKITYVYIKKELVAPVPKGEVVGKIVVRYDDDILTVSDIVTVDEAPRDGFMYSMEVIRGLLFGRAFIAAVICFIILLGIYVWLTYHRSSFKRRRKNKSIYRY